MSISKTELEFMLQGFVHKPYYIIGSYNDSDNDKYYISVLNELLHTVKEFCYDSNITCVCAIGNSIITAHENGTSYITNVNSNKIDQLCTNKDGEKHPQCL